jgi:hypothetical protein
MPEQYLTVSNPPHKSLDPASAARALNMTVAEARMKYNFPAPEVWFTHADLAAAQQSARTLVNAGLGITLVPGSVLSKVPITVRATELAADQAGLTVTTRSPQDRWPGVSVRDDSRRRWVGRSCPARRHGQARKGRPGGSRIHGGSYQ